MKFATGVKDTLYFTRPQLIAAAKEADRTKRNRRIAWEKLSEEVTYFLVTFWMVHNDVEMRVEVMMDGDGRKAYLDIPFETFHSLGRLSDLQAIREQELGNASGK